jgi:hypothetical protein
VLESAGPLLGYIIILPTFTSMGTVVVDFQQKKATDSPPSNAVNARFWVAGK